MSWLCILLLLLINRFVGVNFLLLVFVLLDDRGVYFRVNCKVLIFLILLLQLLKLKLLLGFLVILVGLSIASILLLDLNNALANLETEIRIEFIVKN